MKKVLQITGSLRLGGLETVATNFAKYKQDKNIQYFYLVYGEEIGEYEETILQYGGIIIHIPTTPTDIFNYYYEFKNVLDTYGPFDAIHCHTSFSSAISLLISKRYGIPKRITHSHTDRSSIKNSLIRKLYIKVMQKIINKSTTDAVACSLGAGKYLFGDKYFLHKGTVILNGINEKDYQFDVDVRKNIRKQLKLDDHILLGHVGTLNDVKNQSFLLEIIYKISRENEKFKLLLVGNGPDYKKLNKRIKELNIEDNVFLVGQKENANDYLMAIDFFLFPSKLEGLGLAAVEAQISGLPTIISQNVPEEVIATTNCFKLPLNVDLWCDLILQNKGINRESKFIEQFEMKRSIKKIEELYY
ncbi:glycosyltransferase [Aerococcus urinaeequi]|uniref:glycosyltransferase n=1 Tax=Aerococcus urinaeequi TaxID=51665 RepID=UPI003B4FAEA1